MKQETEIKIKDKKRYFDLKKHRPDKKIKMRANIIVALLCVIGFALGFFGIFRAQFINGAKYKNAARKQQYSDIKLQSRRGIIYDANMKVMAKSADVFKVFMDPHNIKSEEDRKTVCKILSDKLNVPYDEVYSKSKDKKNRYIVIKNQVEYNTKVAIEKELRKQKKLSGIVGYDDDVKRYYPFSNTASTVLGFTGDEDRGLSGIEYYYNKELTGISGRNISAKDALSGTIETDFDKYYASKNGSNLVLTIDTVIQHYLDEALEQVVTDKKANYGCGIVMNVKTGAILAMSTKPDFNLNKPHELQNPIYITELDKIKDEAEKKAMKSKGVKEQWKNRCIIDTYEPGSVFKCFTAAASLEENVVTPKDRFYCSGKIQIADRTYFCHDHRGHKDQDLKEAIVNSCNPVFIEVGQKLGAQKFFKYFEAFGFTEKTEVDLPSELSPTENSTYHGLNDLGKVQLASSSFGQSFQITPLQIISAISSIGNDGKLMKPYIVDRIVDENQNTVKKTYPTVKRQVISKKTADLVTDMMEEGVKRGTAKNAFIPGYRVAGKTGTSQKLLSPGKYIASFAGFAPADDPEIAILIMVDEPTGIYYGGSVAAPPAAEVLKNILSYYNIEPEYSAEELTKLNVKVPKVTGMNSNEAKSSLQSKGYSVKVIGGEGKVLSQIPESNNSLPKNGTILLITKKDIDIPKVTVPNFDNMTVSSAMNLAKTTGLNLKLSGYIEESESLSYKQSAKAGTQVPYASTVTVYFKSSKNIADA